MIQGKTCKIKLQYEVPIYSGNVHQSSNVMMFQKRMCSKPQFCTNNIILKQKHQVSYTCYFCDSFSVLQLKFCWKICEVSPIANIICIRNIILLFELNFRGKCGLITSWCIFCEDFKPIPKEEVGGGYFFIKSQSFTIIVD